MSYKAFACQTASTPKQLRRGRAILLTLFWMAYSALVGAVLPLGVGVTVATVTSCKKKAKAVTNATNTTPPNVTPGAPTVVTPGAPIVGQPQ